MINLAQVVDVLSRGTRELDDRLEEVLREQRRTNELLEDIAKKLADRT